MRSWRGSVSVLPRRVALDCETCNDLNDGDIADYVILCARVPAGGAKGDSGGRMCPGVLSRRLLGCFRQQGPNRCDDLRAIE
jgi:hypothetical protein